MEKLLRSRIVWLVIIPTITILIISIILSNFNFQPQDLLVLFAFFPNFPIFAERGLGIETRVGTSVPIFGSILAITNAIFIWTLFIWFIVVIKKINKRNLYLISLIFLILIISGIRGCTMLM